MTPSELLFKLKNLPPDAPITAEQIISILGVLQASQTVSESPGAFSSWDGDKLIDTETLADWLGEKHQTLRKWRLDGVGPKYIKGGSVRYRVRDVRLWLDSKTVQSTTQADHLRTLCSQFDGYAKATIFELGEPVPLIESIENLNDETEIDGFEVLLTMDPLAAAYLGMAEEGDADGILSFAASQSDLNAELTVFRNGRKESCRLSHLAARYPLSNDEDYGRVVVELCDMGMDCRIPDSEGADSLSVGNDMFEKLVLGKELRDKLKLTVGKSAKRKLVD